MGILESMNIGSNALKAHGLRLDIHAKNIANIDTPNYVRRIPVLNASEDISFHGLMNTMKNDVFAESGSVVIIAENDSNAKKYCEDNKLRWSTSKDIEAVRLGNDETSKSDKE